jgi:hypothetical protein
MLACWLNPPLGGNGKIGVTWDESTVLCPPCKCMFLVFLEVSEASNDMCTQMVILVLSDYLYVLAMLKTTPLLVTIGISLAIPFAVLGDFILNLPVRGQVIMGAALVLLSFIIIGLDTSSDRNEENGVSEP